MSDETTQQVSPQVSLKEKNEQAARIAQLVHDNSQSIDRMDIMAHLLNVFNLAILKQAGRPQWNAADAYLFTQALSAVDQIGEFDDATIRNQVQSETQRLEADIAASIRNNNKINRNFVEDDRLPRVVSNN